MPFSVLSITLQNVASRDLPTLEKDFAFFQSAALVALGVVLFVLILLIVNAASLKRSLRELKGEQPEENRESPAAAPREFRSGGDELIAVIAAAVYAYGETAGKTYAVRSVRPAGRGNWAAAGAAENTRPF